MSITPYPRQADYTQAVQYHLNGEGLDLPHNEVNELLVDFAQAGNEIDTNPAQAAKDAIDWMNVVSE